MKKRANFFLRAFFSRYDCYFYKQIIPNYLLGLVFLTVLIMLNQLFVMAKLYFEYNVPFMQVMALLANLIPLLMSFSIPFAVMPGYLITMGRLSSDSEVVALKACGVSASRIIRPGIIFGILICLFSYAFKEWIEMPANANYIRLNQKIMAQKPAVELMENQFIEMGNFKINFARMKEEGGQHILFDIHLIDIAGKKTIEAAKGRLFTDPDDPEHYILKLADGSMSEVNITDDGKGGKEEHFFISSFKYLAINRIISFQQGAVGESPETMSSEHLLKEIENRSAEILKSIAVLDADKHTKQKELDELKKTFDSGIQGLAPEQAEAMKKDFQFREELLKNSIVQIEKTADNFRKGLPYSYMRVYSEKFSMPIAAVLFALIGLCYGLYNVRSGRNEGLGLSLLVVIAYFGFKVAVDGMVDNQTLPLFAVWLPDIVFFAAGMAMFARKVTE